MQTDRRTFLKIGGLIVVGVTAKPVLDIVSSKGAVEAAGENRSTAKADRRWAMVIDPAKCPESCTDCITACHQTHNVPDMSDSAEAVKWIWKERYEAAFPDQEQEFTAGKLREKLLPVLCNHCDNPPCTRVCPTQATWKRADGIVMMDMHRCIGCRFCMSACPYGSRSFNWRDPRPNIKTINQEYPTREKGVVEKCTFCAERIDKGQQPVCVEACKQKALLFGDLRDPNSEVRKLLAERYSIVRKARLGTKPEDYYLIG